MSGRSGSRRVCMYVVNQPSVDLGYCESLRLGSLVVATPIERIRNCGSGVGQGLVGENTTVGSFCWSRWPGVGLGPEILQTVSTSDGSLIPLLYCILY